MMIMWVTADAYPAGVQPRVSYRLADGTTTHTVDGTSETYTVPYRWYNDYPMPYTHFVELSGLAVDTSYTYQVGPNNVDPTSGSDQWSPEYTFSSARNPTQDQTGIPSRLAMYGDQGTYLPWGATVAEMVSGLVDQGLVDAVMHVGDLSYAGIDSNIPFINYTKADEMEFIWDVWSGINSPVARRVPYMTGVGNHESFYNFTAFTHRYHMPGDAQGGNGNFWFTFTVGSIKVISLSSQSNYTQGSPQWLWAKQELTHAAANRHNVPWIFVTIHRPLLCSAIDEWDQHRPGAPLLTALLPLLQEYKVDMVVNGHIHAYERMHPNINGTHVQLPAKTEVGDMYTNPHAPVYAMVGSGGMLDEGWWRTPQPEWSAYRRMVVEDGYGFGHVTAHNATHLEWVYMPVTKKASDDDRFWIVKA